LKTYLLKAPGTNKSGTQALNPIRGLGGILAAVDIINQNGGGWNMDANCPNLGITFRQYLSNLETRNMGTGNSRWQTIEYTANDSANNWGSVARFSYLMIGVLRNDSALKTKAENVYLRYLGDTSKAAAFRPSGGYIASWDNNPTTNIGIGKPDSSHPGLDGVVIDDINRGGTGYSATAAYFGATGSGLSYPLEAAEYTWATAAVMHNLGFSINTVSSNALIRMGDWFQRANSGGKTIYQTEEAAYPLYRNQHWFGNCFKGGTPYGTPPATSGGESGLARSQPFGDYMCGAGSKWPY
jgi:hypothetical protein